MFLKCLCGNTMSDIASPNGVEGKYLDDYTQEKLQDLVDEEVRNEKVVDMWAEHWEDAGSTIVWKCPNCERLYLNAEGEPENITVYKIERKGLLED